MRTPSVFAAAVALALAPGLLLAQGGIGIGFRGGFLTTRDQIETVVEADNRVEVADESSITGYTVGLAVEIDILNILAFQPELNFQRRGSTTINEADAAATGGTRVRQTIDRNLNYVELPLLLKLGFVTDKFSLAALIGPSFSYAVSGETEYSDLVRVDDGQVVANITDRPGDLGTEGLQRAEVGGHLGLQVGLPLGPGKVIGDLRYQVGFTNLNDDDSTNDNIRRDYEARSRGISLTAGYLFTFGNY